MDYTRIGCTNDDDSRVVYIVCAIHDLRISLEKTIWFFQMVMRQT